MGEITLSYELAIIIVLALLSIGTFVGMLALSLCHISKQCRNDEAECEALDRETVG
ncbi:MAG: hypothetical protein OEX12_13425 [Gammaproteobacteria bacterium]|nr:hypothetical protein [Gammaproteobacteria bacterium]